jgi:uncharacterized glyoxalase superfamily protein PhnB
MNPDHFRIAPYFIVPDVVAAAEFYRDKLGFHFDRYWGEPPGFVMMKCDGIVVMLKKVEGVDQSFPNHAVHPNACWDAYVWVPDAQKLYEEFKSNGVTIAREIEETEYGCRDFDVRDLNGYVLCFGQEL